MATIRETVKIYIYRARHDGQVKYFTLPMEHCDWLVLVGVTMTTVEYDEAGLIDPRAAQLAAAEQELEKHRAESHVKEQQLIDQIQSLKALTHDVDGGRSEPLD